MSFITQLRDSFEEQKNLITVPNVAAFVLVTLGASYANKIIKIVAFKPIIGVSSVGVREVGSILDLSFSFRGQSSMEVKANELGQIEAFSNNPTHTFFIIGTK